MEAQKTAQNGPGYGIKVFHFDSIDSTNLELKRMDAPAGTVVSASRQTIGRGRRGRSFCSPEGGLYISFMTGLDPTMTATAKAAVAVRRAVGKLWGIELKIKWLNDLLLDGKKVCGILAEGWNGKMIVGIGINVCTAENDFSPELRDTVTSVLAGKEPARRKELVRALEKQLISEFFSVLVEDCLEEYREGLDTVGKCLDVIQAGRETWQGTAVGISREYHLIVEDGGKVRHEISSGEVSIRPAGLQ